MLFYLAAVKLQFPDASHEVQALTRLAPLASKRIYEKFPEAVFVFADAIKEQSLSCIVMASLESLKRQPIIETVHAFLNLLGAESNSIPLDEITGFSAVKRLKSAVVKGLVGDDFVLDELGIRWLGKNWISEKMATPIPGLPEAIRRAADFSDMPGIPEELERIYHPCEAEPFSGHPVHYLIELDCQELHLQLTDLLIGALYANRRIRSRRFAIKRYASVEPISETHFQALYEVCAGGTCVLDFVTGDRGNEDPGQPDETSLDTICGVINRFKHSVLTIICVSPIQQALWEGIQKRLDSITFVRLTKEGLGLEAATAYLENLAQEFNVKPDAQLLNRIHTGHQVIAVPELLVQFNQWYDDYIKRVVYPQYDALRNTPVIVLARSTGHPEAAYSRLQRMVGLEEAKSVMDALLNYHRAKKLFMDNDMPLDWLPMHMVFTGNPGTAKTSVARLFAQIMKENGILPFGQLIETSRADLVGKYVGWTARLVKERFKEARGSVLFIDEAYALMDDRDGMFGDEAINAIVQEMENLRKEVVVIFAGYPDKMDDFLRKNPGMSSRVGFHVHFPDYSTGELYDILQSLAEDCQMRLADGVWEKLLPVFNDARREAGFGNGRYVRNLFEKARLRQASRLLNLCQDTLSRESIVTLLPDDFETADAYTDARPRKLIGFSLNGRIS